MTNKQIISKIKKIQKQVNSIESIPNVSGNIAIDIYIEEKLYNVFEIIQNRIIEEVKFSNNDINIDLFFKWIPKNNK